MKYYIKRVELNRTRVRQNVIIRTRTLWSLHHDSFFLESKYLTDLHYWTVENCIKQVLCSSLNSTSTRFKFFNFSFYADYQNLVCHYSCGLRISHSPFSIFSTFPLFFWVGKVLSRNNFPNQAGHLAHWYVRGLPPGRSQVQISVHALR